MKINQVQIDQIKTAFEKMQSKEDLLNLLNEAKPLVYGDKAVPFELKQLTWYSNPKLAQKRYTEFNIKKKSGAPRTIHAPVKGLKALQKTLSFILQCVFEPHQAAMGFVRDKSIVDNAKLHVGSKYVYNIDLKDFFPSIDQARVWKCLQLKPFNLTGMVSYAEKADLFLADKQNKVTSLKRVETNNKGHQIGYGGFGDKFICFSNKIIIEPNSFVFSSINIKNNYYIIENAFKTKDELIVFLREKIASKKDGRQILANIIASLCCTEMEVERKDKISGEWILEKRNVLPQGAPTSPVLTNVVCQRLDFILSGVAKRFGLKYSRYADDITFSSMHHVYQENSDFLVELQRIIGEQGFHIKESKTRLQKDGHRKEVTGLLVNEKANVQQRYIKQLRMWLYFWENYGYERAYGFFVKQYISDKGNIKGKPNMANVIGGKMDYLKMVKGAENDLYLKLKGRFDALIDGTKIKQVNIFDSQPKSDKIIPKFNVSNVVNLELLIPIIHNPKELVYLLKNFSINNSALKYTTHSWDAGRDANMFKDLSEFLSIAESQYKKFSYKLKSLSKNLNGKIYNFLFNKNISITGWGDIIPSKRIYFGWSSQELIEACRMDASLNPEDYVLPNKYQLQKAGKTLQKFKHVIDVFKNEIEIRDENSALLNLIIQKHDTYLVGFADPIISNLDNKTFYTDVQWLSKALDMIFENIQNRPQHRQISYSLNDEREDVYVLEILHIDSFNSGKSIFDEKLQLTKGNFGDICAYLKNLCDWSIESQFSEGCYRINYLTSQQEVQPFKKLENAAGFKHILTFYK